MLAVHLQSGVVTTREIPLLHRPPGFALLRLLVAGICNTDLELQRGYYAFTGTPGHEFVAQVVEADTPHLIGKSVVGEINLACTVCDWCRKGWGRHCPNRTVLGIVNQPGVFAEPLAAACEILDQVSIPPGETIAVLGDGKLGLLVALVLNAHGYPVHQFGRHRDKLRIAEAAGVAVECHPGHLPVAAYEWVVDATGNPDGLRAAISMTRPRGTLLMKSTVHGTVGIDTAPMIVNELTLIGSRCGRFEASLPLLDHHLIRVESMIAGRFPLCDAPRAFARAAERGVLKVLLQAA